MRTGLAKTTTFRGNQIPKNFCLLHPWMSLLSSDVLTVPRMMDGDSSEGMTWREQSVSAARTQACSHIPPEAAGTGKEFCEQERNSAKTHMRFKEVLRISTSNTACALMILSVHDSNPTMWLVQVPKMEGINPIGRSR